MKYNKLIIYACSFGQHGAIEPNIPFQNENSWCDMLGQHYGLIVDNRSEAGTNPDIQFRHILNDLQYNKITADDFVLVQWTLVSRVYSEKYNTIMPAYYDDGPLSRAEQKCAEWFYLHVYDDEYYMNKLLSYVHTIDTLLPNVHHSFADGWNLVMDKGHYKLKQKLNDIKYVGINDMDFRYMLVELGHSEGNMYNYIYQCQHPKVNGHRVIADKYIPVIEKYLI